MIHHRQLLLVPAVMSLVLATPSAATEPILFQGQLTFGGRPVTDDCTFVFRLFDAETTPPGAQVGETLTFSEALETPPPLPVRNGLFSASLDFGDGLFAQELWLDVVAICPTAGGAVGQFDRQRIARAPAAHHTGFAESAGFADFAATTGGVVAPATIAGDDPILPALSVTQTGAAPAIRASGALVVDGPESDASVALPAGSISPQETSGEAGAASFVRTLTAPLSSLGDPQTLDSATIDAPVAGIVMAIANVGVGIVPSGSEFCDAVEFSVSDIDSEVLEDYPDSNIARVTLCPPYPSFIRVPSTVTRLFEIQPGSHTFWLRYRQTTTLADLDVDLQGVSLTLVFLPTAYGNVMSDALVP